MQSANPLEYGPFRVRLVLLGVAYLLAAFGALLGAIALQATEISCVRGGGVTCTLDHGPFEEPSLPFRTSAVRLDKIEKVGKSGRYENGLIALLDDGALEHRTKEVSYEAAAPVAARLRAFLDDPNAASFVEQLPRKWAVLAFGLFAWIVAGAAGRSAFSGVGRVRVVLADDRRALLVTRSWLGIPFSTRSIPLDGLRAVELELEPRSRARQQAEERAGRLPESLRRPQRPPERARLSLRTAHGSVPLVRAYVFELVALEEAAAHLRQLLALPAAPAVLTAPARQAPGCVGRAVAAWLGLLVGAGGGALTVVVLAAVTGRVVSDPSMQVPAIAAMLTGSCIGVVLALSAGTRGA